MARKNNYDAIDFQKKAAEMFTPDLLSRLENQPEILETLKITDKYPQVFTLIEAYFLWRQEGENETTEGLKELIELADELTKFINEELKVND